MAEREPFVVRSDPGHKVEDASFVKRFGCDADGVPVFKNIHSRRRKGDKEQLIFCNTKNDLCV